MEISNLIKIYNNKYMERPKNWRKGQTMFNFLEWLKSKGIQGNQNQRMADPFHLSDKEWDEYWEEFNNNK